MDQPEVIEFKTTTLADHRRRSRRRPTGPSPSTFGRTGRRRSLDNGFDPTQPTAWSAEGLLIYLPPEAQDRLFDNITALSAQAAGWPPSTSATSSAFSDERAQRMSERMKQIGSDIEMADLIYQGERNDVVDYLTATGWDVPASPMREAHVANGFDVPDDESGARSSPT